MVKIGVIGAAGRMGRNHLEEIYKTDNCEIAGGLERVGSEFIGANISHLLNINDIDAKITDNIDEFLNNCDAVIDFSSPEATLSILRKTAEKNITHVIGTTGFDAAGEKEINQAAKKTRIIYAPNMSIGVNIVLKLVEKAASILDADYDLEIVEMHHKHKVDSPSGTALGLGKAAAKGRGVNLDDVACKERNGLIGSRPRGEIGFATLRGGDVVGDHTVIFADEGERIEITHKASNRKIFSKGAVRACLWAEGKKSGLYDMFDVLGL